jgi:alpha-L-fucosidase
MSWWIDARYGMFIHWNMSSVAGREISWSRKGSRPLDNGQDPAGYVEDPVYDNLYKKFDPEKFDAKAWVQFAKDAGMKYVVFTAKHHDGFCMWDTKLTDYSIMHTPFKRDVVKELADACHAANMPFGINYSTRDWHNPDFGIGDNSKYVAYMNGQLRELLTNYGKVDILWFDSYGRGDLVNFWKIGETWNLIKSLQPNIIVNNRLTVLAGYDQQPAPYRGDMDTPEQRLGSFQNTRPWESCMCVQNAHGGGWSYRKDGSIKSFAECLKILVGCATGDGNLLLDVGPNAEGVIPDNQADPLLKMGSWLAKYGASVYGTRGGPYRNGAWGGSTYKGDTVYLHVAKWDNDRLDLPPLKAKILKATCLTVPAAAVTVEQTSSSTSIRLPLDAHDPIDTVIALELSGNAVDEMPNGQPLLVVP